MIPSASILDSYVLYEARVEIKLLKDFYIQSILYQLFTLLNMHSLTVIKLTKRNNSSPTTAPFFKQKIVSSIPRSIKNLETILFNTHYNHSMATIKH